MRRILALTAMLAATQAGAEIVTVPSGASVGATMDALQSAVEAAGAKVFARVDHGAGAKTVDADIGESQLLIFGNPEIGTPAMQADRQAGLFLPLKVLVYETADGDVLLAYETPKETFDGLGISEDSEFLLQMNGALQRLSNKASLAQD